MQSRVNCQCRVRIYGNERRSGENPDDNKIHLCLAIVCGPKKTNRWRQISAMISPWGLKVATQIFETLSVEYHSFNSENAVPKRKDKLE